MKRIKLLFIIFFTLFAAGLIYVQAQYLVVKPEDINLDEITDTQIEEYSIPESLVIVPLEPPVNDFDVTDLDWYKGIYYYQISRYNLPAITFHYLVTQEGRLIENKFSGSDRKINVLSNEIENPIIVGYFTQRGSIKFNPINREKLKNIVLDIVNKNNIPLENIYVREMEFVETEQRELKIELADDFIGWQSDLDEMKSEMSENFNPIQRSYAVELIDLSIPTEAQEVGTTVQGIITLENLGEFPIYGGTESELLLSVSDEETAQSNFFINDIWATQTQISLMGSDERFMSDEEKEYEFSLAVPIEKGSIVERFDLINLRGDVLIENIEFKVQIKEVDREIVEILDTETGYLNVRLEPSLASDEVTRVSPGERYFVLEREGSWIKIKIDEEVSGWIYKKYSKIFD